MRPDQLSGILAAGRLNRSLPLQDACAPRQRSVGTGGTLDGGRMPHRSRGLKAKVRRRPRYGRSRLNVKVKLVWSTVASYV